MCQTWIAIIFLRVILVKMNVVRIEHQSGEAKQGSQTGGVLEGEVYFRRDVQD